LVNIQEEIKLQTPVKINHQQIALSQPHTAAKQTIQKGLAIFHNAAEIGGKKSNKVATQ